MKNPWDLENKEDNTTKEDNIQQNQTNKDFDIQKFIIGLIKNKGTKSPKNFEKQVNILSLIFGLLAFIWLVQGIYKVNSDENAVVLYFGKYYETTTPGLNFYIPYPIGEVNKASVTTINKEDFGMLNNLANDNDDSLILTGDENIADINFEVQWKIKNIKDYLFNNKDTRETIKNASESVMREVVAESKIDDILANKKSEIEETARTLLQNTLDSYNAGVEVVTLQLLKVDPPKEVIDAFRDVQTAKADKERKINDAEAYENDIIPKARGDAESIIQNAEAYKKTVVANAEGDAERFDKIYQSYKTTNSREITKRRIYIETMEQVLRDNNKIIIDNKLNNNLIKLLDNK